MSQELRELLARFKTWDELTYYISTRDYLGINKNQKLGFKGNIGCSTELSTSSWQDVWSYAQTEAVMSYITTPAVLSINSTSAQDAPGGTGHGLVLVVGVNENQDPVNEFIALNGTTPVNSVNSFLFVNSMLTFQGGATGVNNTGNIRAECGVTNTTLAYIPTTDGTMQQSHFYVPKGWTGHLRSLKTNAFRTQGTGDRRANVRVIFETFALETNAHTGSYHYQTFGVSTESSTNTIQFVDTFALPGPCVFKLQGQAEGSNTAVTYDYTVIMTQEDQFFSALF